MDVFFTSKNTGPSWVSESAYLVYFGTDFQEALNAVDVNMRRYEVQWEEYKKDRDYLRIYSALPQNVDWEMVRFFAADGWWESIVKVKL